MSDVMVPISFEMLLADLLKGYKEKKCFLDVPVDRNKNCSTGQNIGPAAGPHTQLAGNIVAAYGAGASCFELKTVQILTGEALGIVKPCIYAATEVFNTEWSTELSIEEAKAEYIKAYLLLKVLIKEFDLGDPDEFEFIMSVGYDLAGIQSEPVDGFINQLMDASQAEEWKKDIAYLLENVDLFDNISRDYIKNISPFISNTIALSTMHGCKKEEIEVIAGHLLKNKVMNVYVKLNPTLLGKESVRSILDKQGYQHILLDDHVFELDIDLDSAVDMLKRLMSEAEKDGKIFGVKLTNTLPVKNANHELTGDNMYLSGPALYPIAIGVADILARQFDGKLPISYSGGADEHNISDILACGIKPVTVSSLLLKSGGYKNFNRLITAASGVDCPATIDLEKLENLSLSACEESLYQYKERKIFKQAKAYTSLCSACNNCVDLCPNRANRVIELEQKKVVIHIDDLCNECGLCSLYCIKGHEPYQAKFTLFSTREGFENSSNPGVYSDSEDHLRNDEHEVKMFLKNDSWSNCLREFLKTGHH
ncbi:selenate reductase [Eubacteriaceae bacterium ES3]|nr:selenate reductase [Eubacteriaceae bacterium ES3]